MKKIIAVSITNLFIVAISVTCAIKFFLIYSENFRALHSTNGIIYMNWALGELSIYAVYGTLSILSAIASITCWLCILISDGLIFKKLCTKFAIRKQARDNAKAERAEANKQKRIKQLEKELTKLKEDE